MTVILASPTSAHQSEHARAMLAGLEVRGVEARIAHRVTPGTEKTVICWGWRTGQVHRAAGSEVLVMERGYLGDRFAWTSLGWNGLNNNATVPEPPQDGGVRFRAHFGHLLKPWNPAGEYVLICGQVPGDQSLRGRDLQPWYAEQAAHWRARGHQVRFRPHPLAHKRARVLPVPGAPTLQCSLEEALQSASMVVTYNSNAGVDALLAGKPAHVEDAGSMAWEATMPDRVPWLAKLAWRQFTLDEIRSGFAWEHVGHGRD